MGISKKLEDKLIDGIADDMTRKIIEAQKKGSLISKTGYFTKINGVETDIHEQPFLDFKDDNYHHVKIPVTTETARLVAANLHHKVTLIVEVRKTTEDSKVHVEEGPLDAI